MIFSLWAHGKFGKPELNTNLYPRQGQEPRRASSNPSRFLTYLAQQARSKSFRHLLLHSKTFFFFRALNTSQALLVVLSTQETTGNGKGPFQKPDIQVL